MTPLDLAVTQAKLAQIAALSLELTNLDAFIETVSDSSPALEAAELRELAVAVAGVQRVAHRQLTAASDAA